MQFLKAFASSNDVCIWLDAGLFEYVMQAYCISLPRTYVLTCIPLVLLLLHYHLAGSGMFHNIQHWKLWHQRIQCLEPVGIWTTRVNV